MWNKEHTAYPKTQDRAAHEFEPDAQGVGALVTETRRCSRIGCNQRYELTLRCGRFGTSRKRILHEGRRYCSDTCRKLASKARKKSQVTIDKGVVLSTVTSVNNNIDISITYEGQKSGRAPSKMDICASCGQDYDLVDFFNATLCSGCKDLREQEHNQRSAELIALIPQDLSIPDFMRR